MHAAKGKRLKTPILYSYDVNVFHYSLAILLSQSCISLNQMDSKSGPITQSVDLCTLYPYGCRAMYKLWVARECLLSPTPLTYIHCILYLTKLGICLFKCGVFGCFNSMGGSTCIFLIYHF